MVMIACSGMALVLNKKHISNKTKRTHKQRSRQNHLFSMFKEAESRQDKIESTSNNVKVRKNSNIGEGLVTSLHP